MPSDPLRNDHDLTPGDIVMVAVLLPAKFGREEFWWRSFRVVTDRWGDGHHIATTVLRLEIDPDKDDRVVNLDDPLERQVVTKLAPEEIPQGVSAMLMKAIHTGKVEIVPF